MNKKIVLSVNENPEYLFYLPLTVWAWQQFGWEPIVFMSGKQDQEILKLIYGYQWMKLRNRFVIRLNNGYQTDTLAQVSRLYAGCVASATDYLMTGDVDMLPLSDYWKPEKNRITVWGHDLTGHQHIPICYIGMDRLNWRDTMNLYSTDYDLLIKRDLDSMPNAKSEDQVKRWVVDQDLITERINSIEGGGKLFIGRGILPNGYPVGRVDRSAWTLDHPQFIDAHLPRGIWKDTNEGQDNFKKTLILLYVIWPKEDFTWFVDYAKQFYQLVHE